MSRPMTTIEFTDDVKDRCPAGQVLLASLVMMTLGVGAQGLENPIPGSGLPTHLELVVQGLGEDDNALHAFYRARDFELVWLGDDPSSRPRLQALTLALDAAETHGIPATFIRRDDLHGLVVDPEEPLAVAMADVEISRIYLDYARILNTGLLEPADLSERIAIRKNTHLDDLGLLDGIVGTNPATFLADLAPQQPAYDAMRVALQTMRETLARGGWGDIVRAESLEPGQSGGAVIDLRNRLIRMGYLSRTASPNYDLPLMQAVQAFQVEHGIEMTGIADAHTLASVNVSAQERLQQLVSSLERMRWRQVDEAEKTIIVNIPEFMARVYTDGEVLFETNVVVGKTDDDLQTPEFSDHMEYVVINPDWNVPHSIIAKEILPEMIEGKNDWQEIQFLDGNRLPVNRSRIDFDAFQAGERFPFGARQLPGPTNPLGNVKFMFPNRHNIYLHDSPMRKYFERQTRTYSHGCVRVMKAHSLARKLLVNQGVDYDSLVIATRGTHDQVHVYLRERIPVHITYQTVLHNGDGQITFRDDVYGRDKLIYDSIFNGGTANNQVSG